MAGAKSYAHANAVINTFLRGGATPYIALASAVVDGDASTFTELSGGGYARQPAVFVAPTNGLTSNNANVLFPIATILWAVATHALVFDAPTGGTMMYYAQLDAPTQIAIGERMDLPAGAVEVEET